MLFIQEQANRTIEENKNPEIDIDLGAFRNGL